MAWGMGSLARQDGYDPNAFDVPDEQSTGVGWANKLGEILTARPQYDETVQYRTASPLVNITEGDIGRATEAAMGVSGGGMKVETPRGIRAYHSSPHDFDKFDLAKIGSGEGAQAYGHGLYFAESPAVSGQGGQYWDQFVSRFGGPESTAAKELQFHGFDRAKAAENMRSRIMYPDEALPEDVLKRQLALRQEALKLLESDKPVGPRTYEVNINADPARFLDWDKGLHRQSPEVQKALETYGIRADPAGMAAHDDALHRALTSFTDTNVKIPKQPWDPTGAQIYESQKLVPGSYRNKASATYALENAGIPGIKYLDQGSRAAGTGSSNYVVFSPEIIQIMKKYGIAGVAPAGMGALAAQDKYQPEGVY